MATNRISQKMLENLCLQINITLNRPQHPWRKEDGKMIANVGNFHLDYAYGGVKLVEMNSTGGGIKNVLNMGYVSKKELWEAMQSFLTGLSYGKE